LSNDAVSSLDNTLLNGEIINEWKIGKDIKGNSHGLLQGSITWNLPRIAYENNEILDQDSRCPGWNSNWTPPE
jgi:hypothetical protein